MGYYAAIDVVMRKDIAEEFFKEFPPEGDANSIFYNAEITKNYDGMVLIAWPDEKWNNYEITDFFNGLGREKSPGFLYRESNEYGEQIVIGSMFDNPFIDAEIKIAFSSPEEAFQKTFDFLKDSIGEDKAREALDNFAEKLESHQLPGPENGNM